MDKFVYHKVHASLLPLLQLAIDPKDIVDRVAAKNWLASSVSGNDIKPVLVHRSSDNEVFADVIAVVLLNVACATLRSLKHS